MEKSHVVLYINPCALIDQVAQQDSNPHEAAIPKPVLITAAPPTASAPSGQGLHSLCAVSERWGRGKHLGFHAARCSL